MKAGQLLSINDILRNNEHAKLQESELCAKRSLLARRASTFPAPLTLETLARAAEEMTQGSRSSLESCLQAWKVGQNDEHTACWCVWRLLLGDSDHLQAFCAAASKVSYSMNSFFCAVPLPNENTRLCLHGEDEREVPGIFPSNAASQGETLEKLYLLILGNSLDLMSTRISRSYGCV